MRRWNALVVLVVCLMGQTSSGHEKPTSSLVAQTNWVRFDLVLGRITATQIRGGQRNCSRATDDDTCRELLAVTDSRNAASFRYELTDRHQWLTVEVMKRNNVHIVREPQPGSDGVRIEFVQPHEGNIKVRVGDSEHPSATISAESLWHLMLAEPELCQAELQPIFEWLRPHWGLTESARRIEASLFRAASDGNGASLSHVRDLVDELDSASFSQRQQAERKLRAMGVVVLRQFKQLDRTSLTREQRHRIDRLSHDLAVKKADTPERIAAWLLNDQTIWLSMLTRHDVSKRQIAASQLAETHPVANRFDPLAEESQRRKQIDALRLRISARR